MFEYRGFMLDSARHMQSIDEIKKLLGAAALLGFNKFHWHLTEDQGWRFESKVFPELNTVAAVRPYSDFGKTYDAQPYGRVYTQDEMRDIVAFCADRGMDVIPEFDMPGHSSALLSAIEGMSCNGEKVKIKTHQGIFNDVMCPAKERTYEVVFALIDEMCGIFPYEYFHIGGDEAPHKHYEECPDCQRLMRQQGIVDYAEYQGYFMNRIIEYLESKGRHAIVWNDAAGAKCLDKRAVIQYWRENHKPSIEYINSGGRAILSPFNHYYFDYPYDITPLNKAFSFNPRLKGLTDEGVGNIIGVEAPLWTEYVTDIKTAERLLFPRLIAVSHTALGKGGDYREFIDTIGAQLTALRQLGIEPEPRENWTKSRLSTPIGWIKFSREHFTTGFFKSLIKKEDDC